MAERIRTENQEPLPERAPGANTADYVAGCERLPRDPVIEAYKAGIDRTLFRENLRRSPTERFERLMALQRFAEELRTAGRRARKGE